MNTTEEIMGFDEDECNTINLLSSDGVEFTIDRETVKQSEFINATMENDSQATDITVNVPSNALGKILDYMNYHVKNPVSKIQRPLKSIKFEDCVTDSWDVEFINSIVKDDLVDLISYSNYMDIPSLLDLSCAKIASLLKGKSPDEIRGMFAGLSGPSTALG